MQNCRNTAEEHNKTQKLFQILNPAQVCLRYFWRVLGQIQLSVGFASADQVYTRIYFIYET